MSSDVRPARRWKLRLASGLVGAAVTLEVIRRLSRRDDRPPGPALPTTDTAGASAAGRMDTRADPPPTWIRLDTAERNRYWWRTALVTLTFTGIAVTAGLTTQAADRWWSVGSIAVFYSLILLTLVNQVNGAMCLTPEAMEFRTFFTRRSVPWSEVTAIEKRLRTVRSGTWSEIRVVRVKGRTLTVPGAYTARWHDTKFEAKLATIRRHWARAVES